MPCNGPRGPINFRSRSSSAAWRSALGFISRTARNVGPCKFTSSILAKYAYADRFGESDSLHTRRSRHAYFNEIDASEMTPFEAIL